MKNSFYTLCIVMSVFFSSFLGKIESSPIKDFNFSIWSEYKKEHFYWTPQFIKTNRLKDIFESQVEFAKTHQIRRFIIKALDPSSFEFFHPDHFNLDQDNNFLYWVHKLSEVTEVEILFDKDHFFIETETYCDWLSNTCSEFCSVFSCQKKPFGEFKNLKEKLEWVSLVNNKYDPTFSKPPLLRGITLNPIGSGDQETTQNLVNALDQYKYNASPDFVKNNFPTLRRAITVEIHDKALTFGNLSQFPLTKDLQTDNNSGIGISLPEAFPSKGPNFNPPVWRNQNREPLLDHVYVRTFDPRLIPSIYQNQHELPDPGHENAQAMETLAELFAWAFSGVPYVQGPGTVSTSVRTNEITGDGTYFLDGAPTYKIGQLSRGQVIEIRPPFVPKTIQKEVLEDPSSNTKILISSSFDSDHFQANYYLCPIPVNWKKPMISEDVRTRIYYVLSTEYEKHGEEKYFGNWHLQNFIKFIQNESASKHPKGFFYTGLFTNFSTSHHGPHNNLVLYDFSTIPNGGHRSVCDWKLGNE